jgi:hypothetical protein
MGIATVKVEGAEAIKAVFDELGYDLRPSEMKTILKGAAREVVKSARGFVPFSGELQRYAKRDIGIVKKRDTDKSAVFVGMMFKRYDINDQVQPVAPIIQHMTEGFKQNTRRQRSVSSHATGKVKVRNNDDFIAQGFNASMPQQIAAIDKQVERKIKRLQAKLK